MKSVFKSIIVFLLTIEAKVILAKYKPKIVAVTGSVGKTSTKDAIYSVLAGKFFVRKSEKSFNSEIGVPLTIIGCANGWYDPIVWIKNLFQGLVLCLPKPFTFDTRHFPDWLVLEVGADRPGDIQSLAGWLSPSIVVMTRMAQTPVHIEFFKNTEELIKEKGYLVEALKHDGLLVLNNDDVDVLKFKEKTQAKIITFGLTKESNISAEDMSIAYDSENKMPEGFIFKARHGDDLVRVEIKQTIGFHHIYPILAGIAVGLSQGLSMIEVSEALKTHETPKGRMKLIKGIKNTTIIDDSYNSSPIASEEALKTLATVDCAGRKIAVLGDMLELGKHSAEAHKQAGEKACGSAQVLVTVGMRGRGIAEGALLCGMSENNVFQFESSREAGEFLNEFIQPKDIILVKGSQGVRMEKVIEEIMAEPDRKVELLVRQEKEWGKK